MVETKVMKAEKKKTKGKNEIIMIRGSEDFDPFGGITKLLQGFCDPNSKITRCSSGSNLASHLALVEGKDVHSHEDKNDQKAETEKARANNVEEEEEEVEICEMPELKATHTGRDMRVRRGIEVVVFSLLAVLATLYALHRLGCDIQLRVVESELNSEPKNLFNIAYNDEILQEDPEDVIIEEIETTLVGEEAKTTKPKFNVIDVDLIDLFDEESTISSPEL